MEFWDAYTRDEKLTDKVLVRGTPIPEGLYHLTCEVLVRHVDGTYLCMKRSEKKHLYPGYYEATSGGAAQRGENPLQCIRRELREETGIICENFEQVGHNISHDTIYYEFACTVDCDKDSIVLQEGETTAYRWMMEEEFIAFLNSDQAIDRQRARFERYFRRLGYLA